MKAYLSIYLALALQLTFAACDGGTLGDQQAPGSHDASGAVAMDGGASADLPTGKKPDPEFPGKDAGAQPKPDQSPAPDLMSPKPDTRPPGVYGAKCAAPCTGSTRVMYNAKYAKWIKVVRCSPTRYDLFMGTSKGGPFYKIGDGGGHGQDHCELVNPWFTIVNDDDIKSGSCKACNVKGIGNIQGIPAFKNSGVYHRSKFGEQFSFKPVSQTVGIHISCWYECGVSL